jgi:hypothetical protein
MAVMQDNHRLNGWIGHIVAKLGHKTANRPVLTGLHVVLESSRLHLWSEPRAVTLEKRFRDTQTPVFGRQPGPKHALNPAKPGVQGIAGKFLARGPERPLRRDRTGSR